MMTQEYRFDSSPGWVLLFHPQKLMDSFKFRLRRPKPSLTLLLVFEELTSTASHLYETKYDGFKREHAAGYLISFHHWKPG